MYNEELSDITAQNKALFAVLKIDHRLRPHIYGEFDAARISDYNVDDAKVEACNIT